MTRTLHRLSLPFREPFATAHGVIAERELLLLRLQEDGIEGFGEAAPFEPYDGVPIARVEEALLAVGGGGGELPKGAPPQARAAEEMARLDLAARREGRAVGEPGAEAIAVNCTLAGGPPEEVAVRAGDGLRAGFSCFKLKVGLPGDVERVAAVREALGPWPALRVDANGAWSVEEAVRTIERMSPYDLQLVEQPCRTLAEMAEVRGRSPVPVAADESIASAGDARVAAELGACDVVNVKLATAGGFGPARAVLREAATHGLERFLSSTLDGPWGIAAALRLAASEGVSLACGLATLDLFETGLTRALPAPADGLLAVPEGPGLGVAADPAALELVTVERLL